MTQNSTINVRDIFDVFSQHNFPNQKQAELLQIIGYVLHQKQYPDDIIGIIDRKIQLLQQHAETPEKNSPKVASVKVRSVVILQLLQKLHLGTACNDLTKICKLIAFLLGNSYNRIYNELQKGICFSPFHSEQIDKANELLAALNSSISIDKNKQP